MKPTKRTAWVLVTIAAMVIGPAALADRVVQTSLQDAPLPDYDWGTLYGVAGGDVRAHVDAASGAVLAAGTQPYVYGYDVFEPVDSTAIGTISGEYVLWADQQAAAARTRAGAAILTGFDPLPGCDHAFAWVQTYWDDAHAGGVLDDQVANFPAGQTNGNIPGYGTHWNHPAAYDIFDDPFDGQASWADTVIFETALVCYDVAAPGEGLNRRIHPLGSFTWSFTIEANGTLTGLSPHQAGGFNFGPSQNWINIVNAAPQMAGWVLDFDTPCRDLVAIPEPGTLVAVVLLALVVSRRRLT
ncbi:MAG: hypothetical protein JXO22_18325 [Phycisphaerae bacterium]|nr:hypothetical protein [Phycisphaerae bacterium]